ncbi:hypothetical protein GOODEAATRI_025914, partial [Goodea atripinnis]
NVTLRMKLKLVIPSDAESVGTESCTRRERRDWLFLMPDEEEQSDRFDFSCCLLFL